MLKIGATNFRKFQKLEAQEIRPITFLVGRNNSGKSTLVKAIMLVNDYLNSNKLDRFSFVSSILNETNIVSFGRAKNKSITDSNSISFEVVIDEFEIEIVVSGNEDDTTVKVLDLIVKDTLRGFLFELDYRMNAFGYATANVSAFQVKGKDKLLNQSLISVIDQEINRVQLAIWNINSTKISREYIELTARLNSLKEKRALFIENNEKSDSPSDEASSVEVVFGKTELSIDTSGQSLRDLADLMKEDVESGYESVRGKEGTAEADDETTAFYLSYKNAYDHRNQWAMSFRKFATLLSKRAFHFIGATSMKQNSLLSIKDSANPLAVAVHNYFQKKLHKNSEFNSFVLKWMRLFEIGDDFTIEIHEGEAYSVKVKSDDYLVPIADKGMGSIQAFIIILKIAYLGYQNEENLTTTILVEEPELNLHPALQSLLADLFLDAYEKFKLEFVIETHSEYMIRNTQLIVKQKEFEKKGNDNPFAVIYFDKDSKQWRMNYREDGKFAEDFGKGFYSEAARLTIDLL